MGKTVHPFFVILARIGLLVYFGMVIYVCFGHFEDLPDMNHVWWGIPEDKIIHFIMFLPFPVIAVLALNPKPGGPRKAFLLSLGLLACGILIAAATEIGQGMTDYRQQSGWDWVADISALTISTLFVYIALLLRFRFLCKRNASAS